MAYDWNFDQKTLILQYPSTMGGNRYRPNSGSLVTTSGTRVQKAAQTTKGHRLDQKIKTADILNLPKGY